MVPLGVRSGGGMGGQRGQLGVAVDSPGKELPMLRVPSGDSVLFSGIFGLPSDHTDSLYNDSHPPAVRNNGVACNLTTEAK